MKKLAALIKAPFPKFAHKKTTLSEEDVIKRAGQFFTDNGWAIREKFANGATFKGRSSVPLRLIFLTVFGFLFFIIPGVIVYRALVKRVTRSQSILVRVKPVAGNSEVTIIYCKATGKLINKFQNLLPPALTMK